MLAWSVKHEALPCLLRNHIVPFNVMGGIVFVNLKYNTRSISTYIHFNNTPSEISLSPCMTFFSSHHNMFPGRVEKRANTMEHQANYVAVNYWLLTEVRRLADVQFPFDPACLNGLFHRGHRRSERQYFVVNYDSEVTVLNIPGEPCYCQWHWLA